MMNRAIVALLAGMAVLGCADTHQLVRNGMDSNAKLSRSDSIYIAVSKDGLYGSRTYLGSGLNSSQIILAAFAKQTQRVEVASTHQELTEALKYTRSNNFSYLIYPTILHWEDRATEWSGIPDKVEIRIDVIESTRGDTIDSAIIKGKSGLATFGGDHPQDLLPNPVEEYVTSLYH